MNEKILFVDDDPNILAAFRRYLRKEFSFETTLSGQEALEVIEKKGPFAVIVADMRMPEMDGIEFLRTVKESYPDSVRMMLTGNADQQTAIGAINEGYIFRFLNKPCPQETLSAALRAGIEQYRLITVERELLKETLQGSVKVLTEMLSMLNPVAFSQSMRIRKYVKHIAEQLELPQIWQFEMAAMLSQIGCVTIPPDILEKRLAGVELTENEQKIFSSHPLIGNKLLSNIPRLELIAGMIEGQQRLFSNDFLNSGDTQHYIIVMGAQILRTTLDFDTLLISGNSHKAALGILKRQEDKYNPLIISALENFNFEDEYKKVVIKSVTTKEIMTGMIANEDIKAPNGILLVPKDQEISYPALHLIRNFSQGIGIVEPFRVKIISSEMNN